MSKQIYINLPVSDLEKSTAFYEALGFEKDLAFSDGTTSAMRWSDNIVVMLLMHDFYKTFIGDRKIADAKATSGVLLALALDTKEAVQEFADTAQANGGSYYKAGPEVPEDVMFGYEVSDPDGHIWEPVWTNDNFDSPQ